MAIEEPISVQVWIMSDEKFTKEHLRYAKEHYIADTGLDNGMAFFFQAISPEKEDAFLEIINNSGI